MHLDVRKSKICQLVVVVRRLVAIKHLADIGYGAFDNLPQGYQRPPGSFFGLSLFHIFYFFCPGGRGRSRTCSRGLAGVPLGAACSTLCPPLPGVLAPRLPLSRASLPCPPTNLAHRGSLMFALRLSRYQRGMALSRVSPPHYRLYVSPS